MKLICHCATTPSLRTLILKLVTRNLHPRTRHKGMFSIISSRIVAPPNENHRLDGMDHHPSLFVRCSHRTIRFFIVSWSFCIQDGLLTGTVHSFILASCIYHSLVLLGVVLPFDIPFVRPRMCTFPPPPLSTTPQPVSLRMGRQTPCKRTPPPPPGYPVITLNRKPRSGPGSGKVEVTI